MLFRIGKERVGLRLYHPEIVRSLKQIGLFKNFFRIWMRRDEEERKKLHGVLFTKIIIKHAKKKKFPTVKQNQV